MDPSAIGQVVLLVITILGIVNNLYREKRNRAWDIEDRRETAARTIATAQALAQQVQAHQVETAAHADVLVRKIDANTEISEKAFYEANDVNLKIARLTEAQTAFSQADTADRRARQGVSDTTLARVDEATQETLGLVRATTNGATLDRVDETTLETLAIVQATKNDEAA